MDLHDFLRYSLHYPELNPKLEFKSDFNQTIIYELEKLDYYDILFLRPEKWRELFFQNGSPWIVT